MRTVIVTAIVTALLAVGTIGCKQGKPSESQCKKAVENIRRIVGLDKADLGARPEAMVRSCRANATKADADCMINAQTVEDLEKCEGETGAAFYEEEEERERKEREKRQKDDPKRDQDGDRDNEPEGGAQKDEDA